MKTNALMKEENDPFSSGTRLDSMWDVLGRNVFLVKERVELTKAKTSDSFDLLDPETDEVLLECREPFLGPFTRLFRFLAEYASMTPIDVVVSLPNGGPQVVRIKGGVSLVTRSHLNVYDENNAFLGSFHRTFLSLGESFQVLNQQNQVVCELKGKLLNYEFTLVSGETQIGRVTRQWTVLNQELLKSATQYAIVIDERVPKDSPARQLIVAAAMCIDKMVRKKGRHVG
jgi:uncharacterized protein YxjI